MLTNPRHANERYRSSALRARRALKSGARSPLGVPSRLSPDGRDLLAQLQAMLPGTWRERTILWTANRGEDRGLLHGRYPRPPVPVQGLNTHSGRSTGALMPKAARERVTSPRAGAALAPMPGSVSRTRPFGRDLIAPLRQRRLQSTCLSLTLQATITCMPRVTTRPSFGGFSISDVWRDRSAARHSRIKLMQQPAIGAKRNSSFA